MSPPPSPKRRKLNTLTRSISPPPLRRQRPTPAPIPNPDPAPAAHNPTATSSSSSSAHNTNISNPVTSNQDIGTTVDDTLEVVSWNVNGIGHLLPEKERKITTYFGKRDVSTEDEDGMKSGLRGFLKRHNWPGIVALQEIHISPSDTVTQELVRKAANEGAGKEKDGEGVRYEVFFSLPRDKYNARGLGGKRKVHGVCTLVRADIQGVGEGETRDVGWDLEGRVLVTSLPQHKLVVVNGYWPNGTDYPYRDSQTGEVVGTRHDFKRKFHELMLGEVKAYKEGGWGVLLIGDVNVAPKPIDGFPGIRMGDQHVTNRADFNWKFLDVKNERGMRGVDSWRWFKGGKRGYTYHGERAEEWGVSCDRVDLGFVSRGLVEGGGPEQGKGVRLVGASIWESVEERGGSDHVPIGVTLDLGEMRGGMEGK